MTLFAPTRSQLMWAAGVGTSVAWGMRAADAPAPTLALALLRNPQVWYVSGIHLRGIREGSCLEVRSAARLR